MLLSWGVFRMPQSTGRWCPGWDGHVQDCCHLLHDGGLVPLHSSAVSSLSLLHMPLLLLLFLFVLPSAFYHSHSCDCPTVTTRAACVTAARPRYTTARGRRWPRSAGQSWRPAGGTKEGWAAAPGCCGPLTACAAPGASEGAPLWRSRLLSWRRVAEWCCRGEGRQVSSFAQGHVSKGFKAQSFRGQSLWPYLFWTKSNFLLWIPRKHIYSPLFSTKDAWILFSAKSDAACAGRFWKWRINSWLSVLELFWHHKGTIFRTVCF